MNSESTQNTYNPHLQRNLKTRLMNRFKEKYRFMGGDEIIQFIVDDILILVDDEYRSLTMLRKGQILWDGVDIKQKRKPGRALSMKETKTRPIILTLITEDDIKKLQQGSKFKEIRKDIIERITHEAFNQGTVLNQIDIGLLISHSTRTIRRSIKEREAEKNIQLPTRGNIHDLGPGVTHKKEIMRMQKLQKFSILEIKRRTNHSTEAIERYRRDYDRVDLLRSRLHPGDISFVTGMSERLVNEYLDLMREIDEQRRLNGA